MHHSGLPWVCMTPLWQSTYARYLRWCLRGSCLLFPGMPRRGCHLGKPSLLCPTLLPHHECLFQWLLGVPIVRTPWHGVPVLGAGGRCLGHLSVQRVTAQVANPRLVLTRPLHLRRSTDGLRSRWCRWCSLLLFQLWFSKCWLGTAGGSWLTRVRRCCWPFCRACCGLPLWCLWNPINFWQGMP